LAWYWAWLIGACCWLVVSGSRAVMVLGAGLF
jgi:hypothetical protein